ncbi:hypothetical protein E5672_10175 [Alteromonas portus]|uniref:Uncharacterized protein n=1 Tax=Alteromonas portus TaxID=2565549 RepID=A0A4U0ZFI0_9ALTE|nr:hypothetical protein [Alteromonas portus]TKB03397.1 hypothetical protein E5672_10175 [Alteromonas portus]
MEEALDFLLSPNCRDYEYDVEQAKEKLANDNFNSTEVIIQSFAKRFKNYDRERLLLIVELAFNEGWESAKKSKKRTGSPRKEALNQSDLYNRLLPLPGENQLDNE